MLRGGPPSRKDPGPLLLYIGRVGADTYLYGAFFVNLPGMVQNKSITNKRNPGSSASVAPEYHNLKDIKSIGFAYVPNPRDGGRVLKGILEILDGQGIPYSGLVIEPERNTLRKIELQCPQLGKAGNIETGKKKFFGYEWIPAAGRSGRFFDRTYDLFICFNSGYRAKYDCIAKKTAAKMKAAMQESKKVPYTIVIQGNAGSVTGECEFLKELFRYLKEIKSI